MRLAAVETHPIQYKAPLFRALAEHPEVELNVLFAMFPEADQQGEGFGVSFTWDVPLLDGYAYEVLDNRARSPSVCRFFGCDTPGILDVLKKTSPDGVLINGWVTKACLQALWACKRLGIPCMVRGEANDLRRRPAWKRCLQRLLVSQYDACLYIGLANRDFYRARGVSEDRLFYSPYSVDHHRFQAAAEELAPVRNRLQDDWGIPGDRLIFLFVGKMEPKKRPQDILQALAMLRPMEREKVQVLFVGEGPLFDELQRHAQQEGLPATFAGFINQSRLPEAYAIADVLILPSDAGETWGLVVNEAMASGRPAIVSSSAGCCRDLIQENITGYQITVGDIEVLAGRVREYVNDPELARQQGRAAQRHIQDYGIQQSASGVLEALRHLAKGRSRI